MAKKAKGRGKGKCAKKNRVIDVSEAPEVAKAPHSFVLHRGLTCPYISDLTKDFRRIMEPFTASSLKERKANKIKDFVSLSAVFHVSHMCVFNKAQTQLSFKAARLPRGPTLTFKVHAFTLARDVLASSRKQYYDEESFQHPPLVVMNNFTGEGKHLKLMATTFQNMFPSINLAKIELSTIKRCVIFSYNPVTKLVDMRHFAITVVPAGLNRGVKKMVQRKIPNLGRCEDVSEFLTQGYQSESEFEDDEAHQVVLPQTLKSRGNTENSKSAVRLHEIGPRLTLELSKIEEGLMTGEVLFHETIVKTEEEIESIRKQREKKKRLKEHRKKTQAENTEKKERNRDDLKQKSLAGMKRKHEDNVDENGVDNEPDNDAEYYRQEVGEEPDEQLFTTNDGYARKQRGYKPKFMNAKRRKVDSKEDGGGEKKKFYKKNDDQNDRKRDGKFKRGSSDGKFKRGSSDGKQRDGKFKKKQDDGKHRDRKSKPGMKPKRNRK